MISFASVCAIIAIFLVVLAENKEWDRHTKMSTSVLYAKWDNTGSSCDNFQCGTPQPKSFTFRNIYKGNDENKTANSTIQPWAVVLHRCESAGCCAYGYRCAVAGEKMVTFVFKINERKSRYIEVQAKNETSCSCQSDTDMPK